MPPGPSSPLTLEELLAIDLAAAESDLVAGTVSPVSVSLQEHLASYIALAELEELANTNPDETLESCESLEELIQLNKALMEDFA